MIFNNIAIGFYSSIDFIESFDCYLPGSIATENIVLYIKTRLKSLESKIDVQKLSH